MSYFASILKRLPSLQTYKPEFVPPQSRWLFLCPVFLPFWEAQVRVQRHDRVRGREGRGCHNQKTSSKLECSGSRAQEFHGAYCGACHPQQLAGAGETLCPFPRARAQMNPLEEEGKGDWKMILLDHAPFFPLGSSEAEPLYISLSTPGPAVQ